MESGTTARAGFGLAVLSAASFGTSGSLATGLLDAGWSPGATVTTRVVLAALLLTPPALLSLRGRTVAWPRLVRTTTLYGLFAVATAQLCFFNAVQTLSVGVALLLEYSGALLVVGWMWARHAQRPRLLTVAGAALSSVGLLLVLRPSGDGGLDHVGVLWGLAAATGLAVYFVMSAGPDDGLPALVVAWGGLAAGGVGLAVAGAAGVMPMHANRQDVVLLGTQVSWVVPVVGLSLVAGAVAYATGIAGARLLGARLASFVGLSEVLFAVVLAFVLLDERLSAGQLLGGVVVLAGIALVRVDELRGGQQPGVDPDLCPELVPVPVG